MNKIPFALATMAIAGAAQAQSSVTLFGNVDLGLARGTGTVSSVNQLISGGMATSIIGFRGVEDLGGGLHAGFWLEAQFAADSGQGSTTNANNQNTPPVPAASGLTFNRRSTVSLGGNWGQLILGRDYTPIFWSNVVFDPFAVNGVGTSQAFRSQATGTGVAAGPYTGIANATSSRASNSISYAYGFAANAPTTIGSGGPYLHLMHFLGENASGAANSKDGSGSGARIGYVHGPLNVAAGYLASKYAVGPGGVTPGDIKSYNFGASYNFGPAGVRAMYSQDEFGPRTGKGWILGMTAPMGTGLWRASYSTYQTDAAGTPKTVKVALGYVHSLSKRTALYGTYARVRNSGGAAQALNGAVTAPNAESRGFDVGIRHTF